MISRETYWNIHRLHELDRLTPGQVARILGMSETTARKWLETAEYNGRKVREISSIVDRWTTHIDRMLARHPYTAMQIFQELAGQGYDGSYSTVRRYVIKVRPPQPQAFLELSFEPGEAAQVDFGSCGTLSCGNVNRRLSVLMAVLCDSRLMYAEFVLCERLEHFLECQKNAFEAFRGVPRRVIVDNCKCAVLRHARHGHVEFNPRYLDFAGHYDFETVACNVRSPHEKGIAENAIGYFKKNFLSGREFTGLDQANCALRHWLENVANVRVHGTTGERPIDRFAAAESAALKPLPAAPFDCAAVEVRRADNRCRVSFDGNAYSVPQRCAGKQLTVKAKPDAVLLYDKETLVARHQRCYARKCTIADPDHNAGIREQRRRAREQNLRRDFLAIGPVAENFAKGLEDRQLAPRSHIRKIMAMVEMYGSEAVEEALESAVRFQAFRAEYIEHLIMQTTRPNAPYRGALHVPKAGDLLDIDVRRPDLDLYTVDGQEADEQAPDNDPQHNQKGQNNE